jgi:hypothetical protein
MRRLFLAMQGFTGPWCLLPGNHDAALSESVWTRVRCTGNSGHSCFKRPN